VTRWTWRGMPRSKAGARRREAPPARDALALDGAVLGSAALLSALGLVMIYSATAPLSMGRALPPHFVRHLVALVAAAAVLLVALRVPLEAWRRAALPLWVASTLLLLVCPLLGVEANGARRWLAVPGLPFRLQPAELAKFSTVLAVAAVHAQLSERAVRRGRGMVLSAALFAPPALLLVLQPDFGNAVVLCALVGLVLFAAGTPLRRLLLPALAAGGAAAAYVAARPYALARLRGFLDPWETARAEGFQLVQSFVAFGRGGTTGVGLGDGRQKLFYLPEAHTDFILSVVAEELGLVGVLVVLGAFAAFAVAGTRIALRAREPFPLLLAFGMTTLVAVPAAVNAGVVTGVLPTTGLTLPFLSFGGNSLLVCALAVGILLRIGADGASPRSRWARVATRLRGRR